MFGSSVILIYVLGTPEGIERVAILALSNTSTVEVLNEVMYLHKHATFSTYDSRIEVLKTPDPKT